MSLQDESAIKENSTIKKKCTIKERSLQLKKKNRNRTTRRQTNGIQENGATAGDNNVLLNETRMEMITGRNKRQHIIIQSNEEIECQQRNCGWIYVDYEV